MGAQLALCMMVEVEKMICSHNSPLNIRGEAIDIDHRITKQQYTTLFPLNGTWLVERPVVDVIKLFGGKSGNSRFPLKP